MQQVAWLNNTKNNIDMKHMYKQPETEVTPIASERLMDSFGASPQGSYPSTDIPEAD